MPKIEEVLAGIEDDDLKQSIQSAYDADLSGLKAHQATLMDEAKQAKRQRQELEGKAQKYDALYGVVGDRDQERLAEILSDYDRGSLVKAGQEGDQEELKRRWREQWDVEAKSQYQPVVEERDSLAEERDSLRQALAEERIDNRAMAAAHKHGIDENGMEIVTMLAQRDWQLEDDGQPVTRDESGSIRVGKNGAMSFDEWINGPVRETYPMLFPKPVGSGAPGSYGKGSSAPGAWRDAKSTKEKVEYLKRKNQ